jgi:hypothetical protein
MLFGEIQIGFVFPELACLARTGREQKQAKETKMNIRFRGVLPCAFLSSFPSFASARTPIFGSGLATGRASFKHGLAPAGPASGLILKNNIHCLD